ncbi:abscisate beta-glucosyltransferase-like [Vigna radiata var. radiata]|uniref:Abscisate beta-glucosyltransferase-like n=1 Tax=Vigna radiata var. radiata TaxID=3916 RepID=A0A3Q0EXD8_VIGRR|nr:abscisate beta-glucosyltransferase-like [Vigna radiata var. radiata]
MMGVGGEVRYHNTQSASVVMLLCPKWRELPRMLGENFGDVGITRVDLQEGFTATFSNGVLKKIMRKEMMKVVVAAGIEDWVVVFVSQRDMLVLAELHGLVQLPVGGLVPFREISGSDDFRLHEVAAKLFPATHSPFHLVQQPGTIGGGETKELTGARGVKLSNLFGYESDDVAERLQLLCLTSSALLKFSEHCQVFLSLSEFLYFSFLCLNIYFFSLLTQKSPPPNPPPAPPPAPPHGASSTILATPSTTPLFQKSITCDQKLGLPISIHTLSADVPQSDIFVGPFLDTSALLKPLRQLLLQRRPHCIVVNMFHRWAGEVVYELGIPRILFNGIGCFALYVQENFRHVVFESVSSDSEPFLVPNIPDRIEMTMSQLPPFLRNPYEIPERVRGMKQLEEKSFGTLINNFYDLEPTYVDLIKSKWGNKAWIVGPVSFCNKTKEDKSKRGKPPTIDEQNCLNWLNSKKPSSVLYASFGSLARLPPEQLMEIAYGLEASEQSFIWVVGNRGERAFNLPKDIQLAQRIRGERA